MLVLKNVNFPSVPLVIGDNFAIKTFIPEDIRFGFQSIQGKIILISRVSRIKVWFSYVFSQSHVSLTISNSFDSKRK